MKKAVDENQKWCDALNIEGKVPEKKLRNGYNKMTNEKNQAIFDSGGGITLQLGSFAHHYSDADQAATDWVAYQASKDTSDWDGHEEEAAELEPTYDEIRNGGYRVLDAEDITRMIADAEEDNGWNNIDHFLAAVAAR